MPPTSPSPASSPRTSPRPTATSPRSCSPSPSSISPSRPARTPRRPRPPRHLHRRRPVVVFHKEIKEAQPLPAAEKTPILVSQNYFRADDRYTYIDNERTDKYVADEFLTFVVYGCQVVVTNPTSSRQKLDLLLQTPQGAMPVANAQYTRGIHLDLKPYETKAFEYFFYFPATGDFPHYPVHVAKNEKLIAFAPATTLKVVETPSKIDTTSWDYISQNGTSEQVLKFLQDNNIDRLNLEKIAWRMKDADFFKSVIALLAERHVYNNTLWSYGVLHNQRRPSASSCSTGRVLAHVRPVHRLHAPDHRPGGPQDLPAHGIRPAGQRPGPQAGPERQDPQRPLLPAVRSPHDGPALPPGSTTTT